MPAHHACYYPNLARVRYASKVDLMKKVLLRHLMSMTRLVTGSLFYGKSVVGKVGLVVKIQLKIEQIIKA